MSKFSERFRLLKEERNITLREISNELNITVPNLSYYMKGREPNYDTAMKIANYFEVTVDWLIGNSDYRTPQSKEHTSIIEEKLNKALNTDKQFDPMFLGKIEMAENLLLDTIAKADDNSEDKKDVDLIMNEICRLNSVLYIAVVDNNCTYADIYFAFLKIYHTNKTVMDLLYDKARKFAVDENIPKEEREKLLYMLKDLLVK